MKIGFLINPWAGIGGSVALKGSDGEAVRTEALARGALPKAQQKARVMLQSLLERSSQSAHKIQWFSAPEDMGEAVLKSCPEFAASVHVQPRHAVEQTEATHTEQAVQWFIEQTVDLIVFAGGDGTARDVCRSNRAQIPVLGIPAGVKIHSGVFAVTPHAAGEVLAGLLDGDITDLHLEEVRDIDETAFRLNQVRTRYFGEMSIPVAGEFMQHVKIGGIESDELVLNDIAEWLSDTLDDDTLYFIGSGKSTAVVMQHLGLANTLLGVDAIKAGRLVQSDCTERDILNLMRSNPCKLVISVIGGQGHIFGRGNAQFSTEVLSRLNKDNVIVIGSKNKLKSLQGRPLLVDSGSPEIDTSWAGLIPVITGYNNKVLYQVAAL